MKKRAQTVYEALVIIICGALIIAGFVQAGKSYGRQEAYYKLAVAKDIALTIDLLYGMPGDVSFKYPNDVVGYDIEIRNNVVKIYHTGSANDLTSQSYTFAGIDKDPLSITIKNQKFLKFEKSNGRIKISGVQE